MCGSAYFLLLFFKVKIFQLDILMVSYVELIRI